MLDWWLILTCEEEEESLNMLRVHGKLDMLRKSWHADKLEPSQQLGDMIWPIDKEWGVAIFVKSGAHSRVSNPLCASQHMQLLALKPSPL